MIRRLNREGDMSIGSAIMNGMLLGGYGGKDAVLSRSKHLEGGYEVEKQDFLWKGLSEELWWAVKMMRRIISGGRGIGGVRLYRTAGGRGGKEARDGLLRSAGEAVESMIPVGYCSRQEGRR